MSHTFSNFDSRELSRRLYMMLQDFSRVDEVFGKITAKKSFQTNYASIDVLHNVLLFVFYALLADYGDKSATLHDWLYSGFGIEMADGTTSTQRVRNAIRCSSDRYVQRVSPSGVLTCSTTV